MMYANNVALITGAGAGIGRAAAAAIAARGANVVVCDIAASTADAVAGEIVAGGGRARAVSCDVADDAQVERLFRDLEATDGGPDILVHSAGLFPKQSFADSTLAVLDRVMAVNLRAAFALAKLARPVMLRRGGGAMVFLTSGASLLSAIEDPMQAEFSVYGASKAALDRWALGVAGELGRDGIAVNTLTPGAFVLTPGVRALDLEESRSGERIDVAIVGEAVAWLALRRTPNLACRRLRATDFARTWGPIGEAAT